MHSSLIIIAAGCPHFRSSSSTQNCTQPVPNPLSTNSTLRIPRWGTDGRRGHARGWGTHGGSSEFSVSGVAFPSKCRALAQAWSYSNALCSVVFPPCFANILTCKVFHEVHEDHSNKVQKLERLWLLSELAPGSFAKLFL